MKLFCQIVGGAFLVLLFAFFLNLGMNKSERVDCLKWQDQAKEYPTFYLLQWQADQCKAHNIDVDAPIR